MHLLVSSLYFRFINSHNRKHVSFQVGINHLADQSPKEVAVLRGRAYTPGYNGGLPFFSDLTIKDIPDTMDWRLKGNFHCNFLKGRGVVVASQIEKMP